MLDFMRKRLRTITAKPLFFTFFTAITLAPTTIAYSDAILLAAPRRAEIKKRTQEWSDALSWHGLRLNIKKTKYEVVGE